mgnify:CR=1 FL=1
MVPQNYQKLTDPEQISLMEKLLDIMDDDDDVQNVWHNWTRIEEERKEPQVQAMA